ncbi:hypothetical protein KSP40_PGU015645 [Platanthera guangdongensis]|uniref:RNase H type-1 domain-containing protein n=1 Tax=Platanthera guangdongensis TaxID=2320717 RepID=A0ABR2M6F6_9ASPA
MTKLLKEAPRVSISLIDRKANSAADHVAKLACHGDFLWERGMPLPRFFLSFCCTMLITCRLFLLFAYY